MLPGAPVAIGSDLATSFPLIYKINLLAVASLCVTVTVLCKVGEAMIDVVVIVGVAVIVNA